MAPIIFSKKESQMQSIQITAKRIDRLNFEVPSNFPYRDFFRIGKESHKDTYNLKISYIKTPRTTGDLSQNHKIAFLCNIIAAENAYEGFTTYQSVKDLAKLRAIKRGYPYRYAELGAGEKTIIPYHENEISKHEASYLIDELLYMAAEVGIDIDNLQ